MIEMKDLIMLILGGLGTGMGALITFMVKGMATDIKEMKTIISEHSSLMAVNKVKIDELEKEQELHRVKLHDIGNRVMVHDLRIRSLEKISTQ